MTPDTEARPDEPRTECPACFDATHRGRCPETYCDCFLGPVPDDPTLLNALEGYLADEGNHVGGVWGDYGQVVVDASDIGAYLSGVPHKWERTSNYAATFNQMREALEAAEKRESEVRDELRERVAGLRELSEKATPGEWSLREYKHGGGRWSDKATDRILIADFYGGTFHEPYSGNRDFIVAAVNFVRALLSESQP